MSFQFMHNPFGAPSTLASLIMLAWVPFILYLFSRFNPRQALVVCFITSWLFLPEVSMPLPGLPDYSKISATSYGILLATVIFDFNRLTTFRIGWLDIPFLIWCIVCPVMTSLSNGLGLYDGFSGALGTCVTWLLPYFLGRIYLNNLTGLRQLALGIFVGGLAYVPLCLYEIRMSPQLHARLYGAHAHYDFLQGIRYGGYRPSVFMQHGLAVGAWMMAATLVGIWLWKTDVLKKVKKLDLKWLLLILLITFVMSKSTGAYGLMVIGLGLIFLSVTMRTALPFFLAIAAIFLYLYLNAGTENYFTDQLIQSLSGIFPEERIASLEFRFNNEELMVDHAHSRMMWGWGGWDRARVINPETGKLTIQDSLWIIAFSEHGAVGLISLFSALLLPIAAFCTRYPARLWTRKDIAPAVSVATILLLYVADCLLNAMINPIYILACGAIAGVAMKVPERARSRRLPSGALPERSLARLAADDADLPHNRGLSGGVSPPA